MNTLDQDFECKKIYPTVSIAIPVFNEAQHIEQIIQIFSTSKYPSIIEIFIADGGSTDGTQEIVKNLSIKDPRIKFLNNPRKVQSAALNIILDNAQGDIFLRADAHSDYAEDYIEQCVNALISSKAYNVGGAQRFVAKTPFQAGVALASRSVLGNGGAKYRNSEYSGYAETVYMGCFWRQALIEVGGFDLEQITNQDSELNQRLLLKNKFAIFISSAIRVWYYPRETWPALVIQYFRYGRGRYLTSTKHPGKLPLRSQLPFVCLCLSFATLLIGSLIPYLYFIIVIIFVIGISLFFLESIRLAIQHRSCFIQEFWRGPDNAKVTLLRSCIYCWISLLTMPIAHSAGYMFQVIRRRVLLISGW